LAGSDTFYRPNSFSYSNPAQFIIPVFNSLRFIKKPNE
jgi:hypothetical protein